MADEVVDVGRQQRAAGALRGRNRLAALTGQGNGRRCRTDVPGADQFVLETFQLGRRVFFLPRPKQLACVEVVLVALVRVAEQVQGLEPLLREAEVGSVLPLQVVEPLEHLPVAPQRGPLGQQEVVGRKPFLLHGGVPDAVGAWGPQIAQRLVPPQAQRLLDQFAGFFVTVLGAEQPRVADHPAKSEPIDPILLRFQYETAVHRAQIRWKARFPQRGAYSCGVGPKRRNRVSRFLFLLAPHPVEQEIGTDQGVRLSQQCGENRVLLGSPPLHSQTPVHMQRGPPQNAEDDFHQGSAPSPGFAVGVKFSIQFRTSEAGTTAEPTGNDMDLSSLPHR